ncbi:hypothetical protein [Sedimentibacter sp.]|uniref:hypothetical protein n=1 Tax=Sedimentibacter sp. TaxID=1960295 RepID=UPI000EDA7236|nr:hypothetical protein [Sedimentibacter sp.]HCX63546.1 hypothetical protein [Clostridiales bacterium]
MKEIKIVLTQTNTVVSKTLKLVSKKPYNHISISFEDDCSTMFSFGRKINWFPLIGGFVKENPNSGVFKMHPETKCKIYKLEVTEADYNTILKRLNRFLNDPKSFRYSFLNIFLMYFNIPLQRQYYYVCSSFVSYLLWGIIPFKKEISLVIPDDYNTLELKEVYEGKLTDYVNRKLAYNNI